MGIDVNGFRQLGLTLRTGVHDQLRNHAKQEKLDQTNGKSEASPVMTVFHDLEAVALEINISIKVHFMESLHWDLVQTTVLGTISFLFKVEIEFNRTAGKLRLLIAARANRRNDEPPRGQKRKIDEQSEKYESLEPTAKLPFQIVWYSE